jgi:hypothetical protein
MAPPGAPSLPADEPPTAGGRDVEIGDRTSCPVWFDFYAGGYISPVATYRLITREGGDIGTICIPAIRWIPGNLIPREAESNLRIAEVYEPADEGGEGLLVVEPESVSTVE